MKKIFPALLAGLLCFSTGISAALTLSADRLVYNEADGESSITVHSDESRAYLIQSWIDSGASSKQSVPFVITPPLFRLGGNSDNVIRVVYLGAGLPSDKESLLWLNVKNIPGLNADETKSGSQMVIAISNRVKLFFRPASLKGEPVLSVQHLKWEHSKNTATVSNDSAFFVVLSKIQIDGESVTVSVTENNTVIAPFSKKTYVLKHTLGKVITVNWNAINDYGEQTKNYSQVIE